MPARFMRSSSIAASATRKLSRYCCGSSPICSSSFFMRSTARSIAPKPVGIADLQSRIVERLEAIDGKAFVRDVWQRPEGGGGITRVVEQGNVFERGGVNFSHVHGDKLPPSASAGRPQLAGRSFEVLGVSLVLHPINPFVPTVHMNARFFVAQKKGADPAWWFGGGMDLTPYYGFNEDAIHFHRTCRD